MIVADATAAAVPVFPGLGTPDLLADDVDSAGLIENAFSYLGQATAEAKLQSHVTRQMVLGTSHVNENGPQ